MTSNRFPLTLMPGLLAVCRMDAREKAPAWALDTLGGPLACVVRTADELCVICGVDDVPRSATGAELGFRAFKLDGQIPFSTIGVVAALTGPIATAGLSVFVASTFDTVYLLVKESQVARATSVLKKSGFVVS